MDDKKFCSIIIASGMEWSNNLFTALYMTGEKLTYNQMMFLLLLPEKRTMDQIETKMVTGINTSSTIDNDVSVVAKEQVSEQVQNGNNEDAYISYVPLFKDIAFPQWRGSLLYAPPGDGKSLVTIAVGENPLIQHAVYVLVDSDGGEQVPFYRKALGEKAEIITLKIFQEETENMTTELKKTAAIEIYLQCNPEYRKVQNITQSVFDRMGLKTTGLKRLDPIMVFEAIVSEAVEKRQADFICLDSLHAIVGDVRKVNREMIRRITQITAKHRVTLLVIHHTNKKGDMAGPGSIGEAFEFVYRLSQDYGVEGLKKNEAILRLDAEKAKFASRGSYCLKRTFIDGLTIEYEVLSESDILDQKTQRGKKQNLTSRIEQLLLGRDSIAFADLRNLLGNSPPAVGTVKNCLKVLADRGMVKMTNGSWDVITVIKQ